MRMNLAVIVACAALGGCADNASTTETAVLQGKWRIDGSKGDPLPAACQSITLEIGPSRILARSGTLEMTTVYEVLADEGSMKLRQTPLTHNGGQNCQGIPAEFVVEHFVQDMDAELIDDRLRLYLPSRESGQYTEFVRETDGARAESAVDAT